MNMVLKMLEKLDSPVAVGGPCSTWGEDALVEECAQASKAHRYKLSAIR